MEYGLSSVQITCTTIDTETALKIAVSNIETGGGLFFKGSEITLANIYLTYLFDPSGCKMCVLQRLA